MDERAVWKPTVTPIHQASTFDFESVEAMDAWYEGRVPGFHYTRYGNPTLAAVEARIAALEGAEVAEVTGSGMGAITEAILAFASAGDRIVATEGVYGGTFGLFTKLLPRFGIRTQFVGPEDPEALRAALREPAAIVYVETPSNPTLRLADLDAFAGIARDHGAVTIVDNTVATPLSTRPLEMGCDVVVHSATKAMGGHCDLSAGAIATSRAHMARVTPVHRVLGSVLDPHAAFLLERGLKTLELRNTRMSENALAVATALEADTKVRRVHYPGLASHPQHKLAARQMRAGFGGLLAIELAGRAEAFRFANALRVFHNAASLGGVDSLVSVPVVMSHRGIPDKDLAAMGIGPGTVRLSVGVEPEADLLADVRRALAAA